MRISSVKELDELRREIQDSRDPDRPRITVCGGTGCSATGCKGVAGMLRVGLKSRELEGRVDLSVTGCHGFCECGPIVIVYPQGIFYQRVTPEDVDEIITETIEHGKPVERLLYRDPVTGEKKIHETDIPFYQKQMRLTIGNNTAIDPASISDYLATGGYSALAKVLYGMAPEAVIEEIKRSGLRGRGGGGFPTGVKWESTRNAPGDIKYVICNADEGDPGAYMDRSILEGNPHSVLEGMIIGAYAIGSHEGYVYVRNEYPLAVANTATAIQQARELGLLGEDILGSGFSFDIRINRGGGAFVCGESTALMASLEGKPGEPRAKYIHTSEKGLWDMPSNLNNVETWANVPLIINRGSQWYSRIGTESSKGTKVFSLVGKINNTGLVEVPMGITLREIIFDIGGGIPGGRRLKAVQTGGPSGGCIPEALIDLPVDYERLAEVGSMMGSGGMIVMDENTCMVDIARYFTSFLQEESCGKCVPCREGLFRLGEILTDITQGRGRMEDLPIIEDLSEMLKDASLCGLGTTAANPVMSTLNYFRDEYVAHIRDGKCPAGVCRELIAFRIDREKCTGCGVCMKNCPSGAITGEKKQTHVLNTERCTKCGICYDSCRFDAVKKE
ncbi:NADH:ubiquinone oxidoreductase, NADH-binding (51 kD) subunit [Candidatus Methanoperedens nitroreducens]|uniref:NADH:ubiquinone oxidoreductase, NADH-binding (51 kD) subunit n=1 Tax=Candidatus Methanoperedens nitratireducens TaxID=1392998 RepID=A0A062V2H6_9EURY|nr:NADH-ubiquinone oxidoreductase-F iron-sulfur binding region domain-containing protein [Candidatus Methanoperedens nitroreducens]KCZ71572.1 NADH:ubiquinone oxidoreductase, NADH-binding (51 kD) subunit [Candidatus Methanoperedens nitroreducens]MDJ1421200.1 NADH-ubiquinone oxidoreductase-F iron-sulfur binding region domain-containing protein [Candidatus Methanoperedens sp.]